MKPLRRPAAAITQQRAGLTMMARESKKGKKESDKKSTNRRRKRSHKRRTGIETEDASANTCVPCVLISQQLQLQWMTTPTYPPIDQFHKNVTLSTKRGFLSFLCWKISKSMTFPRGCTMYNNVLLLVVKKSNNKEIATRPPRFPWLIVLFYCTSSNCSVSSFSRPIINSCSTSSSLGYYCQLTPFSFIAPNTQTSLLLQ